MLGWCLIILITLLFPPAGVFLMYGCGFELFINIILTCLGYFPGHIHAFFLMAFFPSARAGRHGQAVYYTAPPNQPYQPYQPSYQQPPLPQGQYASTSYSSSAPPQQQAYHEPPPPRYQK